MKCFEGESVIPLNDLGRKQLYNQPAVHLILKILEGGFSLGFGGDTVAGITEGGSSLAGGLERRLLVAWLIAALSGPPPITPFMSTIKFLSWRIMAVPILGFVRPLVNWLLHENLLADLLK